MLKLYPTEVKLVYKHFPLRSHKFAEPAAIASMAAGKQGKFWEMHDKIFENYNKLSDAKLEELAKLINLDMPKFKADMNDALIKRQVQLDLQNGYAAGVRGTPTIFINGKRLKKRSVDGFREIIDKELKTLQGGKS